MSNQNKSRSQGNPRGLRTSDVRGMKSSAHQTRPNNGSSASDQTRPNNISSANAERGNSQASQGGDKVARLVLDGAKGQVGQLAHQATDIASSAAKATAQAVTRATRATGEAIGKTSDAALQMARANPVPFALTGLGVAVAGIGVSWLIMSKPSGATDATKKVSALARRAGAQAMQWEQQLEAVIKEHPLAAGATLLAVGAAIGLAIPRTALEDSWIGHERDRLMKGARNLVDGVMEKGKALAEQVMPESPNAGAHA